MSDLKKAADILRSLPAGDVTRRQFVTTALAAGFAMAVQPVAAGTLTTDDTGLVAGEMNGEDEDPSHGQRTHRGEP